MGHFIHINLPAAARVSMAFQSLLVRHRDGRVVAWGAQALSRLALLVAQAASLVAAARAAVLRSMAVRLALAARAALASA